MAEKEYIERNAVLEIVKRTSGDYAAAFSDIRKLPAADVATVVHGEWIPVGEESNCDEWKCTACGQQRTFLCEMDEDDMHEYYRFCPHCGAKMDGGKHETD